MKNRPIAIETTVFCGIDVSAATLAVAVIEHDQLVHQREFANRPSGHQELIVWLGKRGPKVRVWLEATGNYSLDLALDLDAAPHVELAVLNPKLVNRFAQTLARSKTDAADAVVLAHYSQRMPFTGWQRPRRSGLELRALARHIGSLVVQQTRELNRLHAREGSRTAPRAVIAVQLLAETGLLAPDLTVRQWVAHSGLDPAHHNSGTSVHKRPHISRAGNRHLRRALYMPALAAVRWDPHLKAFYEALQARHKTKLQALIAVARKMLHAIYGIFKTRTPYHGRKLFPQLKLAQS